MRMSRKSFGILFGLLIMSAPAFAQDAGICETLKNVQKILTGISVVVVTLAVMWAGYKFLFTRAEITECAKILAGGVMIGSAATIAGWFMQGEECDDSALTQNSVPSTCPFKADTAVLSGIYTEKQQG